MNTDGCCCHLEYRTKKELQGYAGFYLKCVPHIIFLKVLRRYEKGFNAIVMQKWILPSFVCTSTIHIFAIQQIQSLFRDVHLTLNICYLSFCWKISFKSYPGTPVDSNRFAICASFDQMSYCHLHAPITPDIILPECTPKIKIISWIFNFISNMFLNQTDSHINVEIIFLRSNITYVFNHS